MSLTLLLLILVSILGTLFLVALSMLVRSMFMATRGKRIAGYPDPRSALVVLDLQEGYAGTNSRQPVTIPPTNGLIATVNRLIDGAAASGMEVAYVRQVFGNNLFVRLHGGKRQGRIIVDRRIRLINSNDFEKNRTDAFSNGEFERLLINRQVNELYLVGVDAAFCVYYTALGALNRGYKVTVVTDAVRSRNDMARVLERYRRKGIGVITSEELLALTRRISP